MKFAILLRNTILACAIFAAAGSANAQGTVKIGFIAEFSGPFADIAKEMQGGVNAYLKQYGDRVAGKKIEFIMKDVGGVAPEVAKRHAQELITRDKVDFLVGWVMTPNAAAVLPVSAEARKPMIMMNSTTSGLTLKSPYAARISQTIPQIAAPLGPWAIKNGLKRVFTITVDYAPGIGSEEAFIKAFKAAGGEILGSVRMPLKSPDIGVFIQRAKDSKPDGVFAFTTGGEMGPAVVKNYHDRGLPQAGIKLFSSGEILADKDLEVLGDTALGVVSTSHYVLTNDSALNRTFVKAYAQANGTATPPGYIGVQAWDGTAAIYEVLRKTGGSTDPDRIMAALRGMKLASPRGSITIDPVTRDIVQTIYVREVQKVGGQYRWVIIDKVVDLKDPG